MSLRFQNVVIRVTDIGLYKQYLLDPEATRSILLVHRQLVSRHTNEELVAEKDRQCQSLSTRKTS